MPITYKKNNVFFRPGTLTYLSPVTQEVVLVLPPESVHRRNLASRRASDAAEETTGNDPPLGDISAISGVVEILRGLNQRKPIQNR